MANESLTPTCIYVVFIRHYLDDTPGEGVVDQIFDNWDAAKAYIDEARKVEPNYRYHITDKILRSK